MILLRYGLNPALGLGEDNMVTCKRFDITNTKYILNTQILSLCPLPSCLSSHTSPLDSMMFSPNELKDQLDNVNDVNTYDLKICFFILY